MATHATETTETTTDATDIWTCKTCTLQQSNDNDVCEVCGKSSKRPIKKKSGVTSLDDTDDSESGSPNGLPSFGMNNDKGDNNDSRPVSDDEDDGKQSDHDEKEPYMDEYQCPQCTLIQHISNRICEACGEPAPNLNPWQSRMMSPWDDMGDCVYYDTVMDITNRMKSVDVNNSRDDFDEFMVRLSSIGMTTDHSKSRALNMLDMIQISPVKYDQNNNKFKLLNDDHVPKANYNKSKENVENAMSQGKSLKLWMKSEGIWEKDLFLVLVGHGITEIPHHLYLIDSWYSFNEIIREVRVLRRLTLKDSAAKLRLDRLCTKFEKLWKSETGFKLTSIHSTKIDNVFIKDKNAQQRRSDDLREIKKKYRKKKRQQSRSDALLEQTGKPLKSWMKKNNIFERTLFAQLLTHSIKEPKKDLKFLSEKDFHEIVRKVRVARFKELKDIQARQRCDKVLMHFEKLWRKASGIKKTSLHNNKKQHEK